MKKKIVIQIPCLNEESTIGKVINCSSNFEISIGDTVKIISDIMNQKIHINTEEERIRPEKSEVNRLFGDNKLLLELTDWEPSYIGLNGFKRGLKLTIDWFYDYRSNANLRNTCIRQIKFFTTLINE